MPYALSARIVFAKPCGAWASWRRQRGSSLSFRPTEAPFSPWFMAPGKARRTRRAPFVRPRPAANSSGKWPAKSPARGLAQRRRSFFPADALSPRAEDVIEARLARRFAEATLAAATLAAYADLLATRLDLAPPGWCLAQERIAPEPWFASAGPRGRLLALRDTPPAFKRRNLFSPAPDLPVRLRAGRPPVSAEQRRANNAERQRRLQ